MGSVKLSPSPGECENRHLTAQAFNNKQNVFSRYGSQQGVTIYTTYNVYTTLRGLEPD